MDLKAILSQFDVKGTFLSADPFGSGHINDTYCVRFSDSDQEVVLQRINTQIFEHPDELMENATRVSEFLIRKLEARGADSTRGALHFIRTKDGGWYYDGGVDGIWRADYKVPGTVSYDLAESPEMFRSSGEAFGRFMADLADYPAETLYEIIPDFHNTVKRFETFEASVRADIRGRAASVADEIGFVRDHEALAHAIVDRIADGRLPLRVTHNDTKINNVLMDEKTGACVCIIDLDTVMPGSCLYDFGDSIRFGATHALEDETDLSKVDVDPTLFAAYTDGYLSAVGTSLTEEEISMLVTGAMVITFETGMRFLTDDLDGDIYFKTARSRHNLDRARTQFTLVRDMERKQAQLERIVSETAARYIRLDQ